MVMKWISVKERLPEKTGYYLVVDNKDDESYENLFTFYNKGSFYMPEDCCHSPRLNDAVTHWMEKPSGSDRNSQ